MSSRLVGLEGTMVEGRKVEIMIAALDAPPTPSWEAILDMLGADPESVAETEVDGRPARRVTERQGDRAVELTAILSGDAVFLVAMRGNLGDAERAAQASLFDSMDFDIR